MAGRVAHSATHCSFAFRIRLLQLEPVLFFSNCWPDLLLIIGRTARPGSETNLTCLREEAVQAARACQLSVAARLFDCAGLASGVAAGLACAMDVRYQFLRAQIAGGLVVVLLLLMGRVVMLVN